MQIPALERNGLHVFTLSFGRMLQRTILAGLSLGVAGVAAADEAVASAEPELYAAALEQQRKPELVMVGTIDENGFPQIRVMSNLRNPSHAASKLAGANDFSAYAVTNADTEKLRHLAKNPRMSMYYQSEAQGLLLMGKTEVLTDAASRNAVWDDAFKKLGYSGKDDAKLVVLRFTPERGKFYYKGRQNHLTFAPNTAATVDERSAVEKTISTYVDGHRQGKSDIMKAAFHPQATVYLGPQPEPARILFDITDSQAPSADIASEIASIDVVDNIGMARVELFNCYGHRYTDMFTLVKTDDGWKITTKVSRRHPQSLMEKKAP